MFKKTISLASGLLPLVNTVKDKNKIKIFSKHFSQGIKNAEFYADFKKLQKI